MEPTPASNPMARLTFFTIFSAAGFLLACQDRLKEYDTQNTPNMNSDTSLTGDSDSLFGQSDLPDVTAEIDTTVCLSVSEDYPNTPGATSYFAGAYVKAGGVWKGREKWLLFPNQAWQDVAYQLWQEGDQEFANIAQGYPCEVSWDISVTEHSELEQCLACAFAFSVEAVINPNITSCPQGLWSDGNTQNWQSGYEIASFNGNSIFYFRSNGQAFGWGYASDDELNFLSEPSCKWF